MFLYAHFTCWAILEHDPLRWWSVIALICLPLIEIINIRSLPIHTGGTSTNYTIIVLTDTVLWWFKKLKFPWNCHSSSKQDTKGIQMQAGFNDKKQTTAGKRESKENAGVQEKGWENRQRHEGESKTWHLRMWSAKQNQTKRKSKMDKSKMDNWLVIFSPALTVKVLSVFYDNEGLKIWWRELLMIFPWDDFRHLF